MQSKRLTKYLGVLLGVMVLCALGLTGLSFFPHNQKSASGATQYMTVQKVFVPDVSADTTITADEFWQTQINNTDTTTNISEGDFVILNTEQRTYIDSSNNRILGREAIAIYFGGTSTSRNISGVTIKFNDRLLSRNDFKEIDNDDGTAGVGTFSQFYFALTPDEITNANLNSLYYTQYGNNDGTSTNENVALPEGKYSISLTYFDTIQGTLEETISFYVVTQKTYNKVNENPTLNDTEKVDATFDDTNSVANIYNQMTANVNYFNFNNLMTTYYDDSAKDFILSRSNPTNLYYPTLIYNPEKFDISYTRTLYNYRETVTATFSVYRTGDNEETGYLDIVTTTTENPTNEIKRTYKIEPNSDKTYTIKMQFDKVGEYTINKTPKLRSGYSGLTVNYIKPAQSSNIVTSNMEYMQSLNLVINGYSAYYTNTTTTTAPLYNDTYSYDTMGTTVNRTNDVVYAHDFLTNSTTAETISITTRTRAETIYTADMTFANPKIVSNYGGTTLSMSGLELDIQNAMDVTTNAFGQFFNFVTTQNYFNQNYQVEKDGTIYYTKRASTNLAPVKFEFYGKLHTGTSQDYQSWYAYKDSSGNVSVNKCTREMIFDDAGEYVVYLTYENPLYSINNSSGSRKNQYMHQIFCFEITNNTPTISVLAQDSASTPTIQSSETAEIISIDSYTNNYVYASWEKAGPFDAEIFCTYSVYDWDGNPLVEDESLTGLVYQTNKVSGAKYQPDNQTATLLCGDRKTINKKSGKDGYYQIRVYRKNNLKAWVNYTFNIDTAPISGIKTLQVIGNTLARNNNSFEPIVISSLDNADSFNLITQNAFGFTWSDKASGAPITAQYLYASITKTTNFDLVKAINNSDDTSESNAVAKLIGQSGTGSVYMPTNASIGDFSPAMSYTKIDTSPDKITATLNASQIINTPQLAFLLLRDAAGNTAIYATMLDTTNTQVLQVEKQSSYVNVITKDTKFYWGTHKSLTAKKSSATRTDTSVIRDIYDFVEKYDADNENYVWTLNSKSYATDTILTKVISDLNVAQTGSINIPLAEATITTDSGDDITVTPQKNNDLGYAVNWYATIKVLPGATTSDPYKTAVVISGDMDTVPDNYKYVYTLENGEFGYQITVRDSAGNDNAGGLPVEVNLDKSLGSLRSYWEYDGTDLSYNRNTDKGDITDRQYVANTYSTNRRYVAFSWTDPGDPFVIDKITLKFYAFSGKNTGSENYPYSDTMSGEEIILYSAEQGSNATYADGKLNHITYTNGTISATYYQTGILKQLIYSADFDSGASESGKYVITRTYKEMESQVDMEGDQMEKSYTYYVDRNTILPTSTYTYGDETLQFGYKQGDYTLYPNYPENKRIIFNNYGLLTNTEKFEKLSFKTEDLSTTTPTNVIVKSNILPASVDMTTWENGGFYVYDKYFATPTEYTTSAEDALSSIQKVLDNYKNSSRLQVAVQFFANNSSAQYSLTSQTFYSTKTPSSDTTTSYFKSLSLNDLKYAFREIGRYRVIMFDLANFEGLLTGDAYTDFRKIAYSISGSTSSKNTLYPNCSVVNFELTGSAPTFNYQASYENNSYGPLDTQSSEITSNATKTRLTWSDSSDSYTARNAYNEVSITKTNMPKGTDTSSTTAVPSEYKQYFSNITKTQYTVSKEPIEITYSDTVADELKTDGLVCIDVDNELLSKIINNGYASISDEIKEKTQSSTDPNTYLPYFLKVASQEALNTIINNGITGTDLSAIEYYKVRKSDSEKLYNYYLLLPKAEIEDSQKSSDKLVDTRYSVSIHYISKDDNDYLVNGSDKYYTTTKDLYLDYTAPYYNLIDLIANDTYLSSLDSTGEFKKDLIKNIDNPNYTFLKSYAFAVKTGFTLNYRNKYESSTYYYYYKHENYTGAKDEQVVTTDSSSTAPRFNKNETTKFVRVAYTKDGTTGYAFNNPGYYDIIEQDTAGNLRVYTIFVTKDAYSIRATDGYQTVTMNNEDVSGKVFDSAYFGEDEKSTGFSILDFSSDDIWLHFRLHNMMSPDESQEFYLIAEDAYSEIANLLDTEKVIICYNISDLLSEINSFIKTVALNNDESHDKFGSRIMVSIDSRASQVTKYFYVNTQGKMLINSETDFLSLITIDSSTHKFTLKMPNTTSILSTKLDSFTAYLISNDQSSIKISYDDSSIPLPTTREEFENYQSLFVGYTFSLANNIVYKFTFVDNFNRTATYSYPIDSSLVKELHFSGGTTTYRWTNGVTYTYTSNDVDFVYQSTGQNISIYIVDMDTEKVLYEKEFGESLDTENKYFTYIKETLNSNIITLRFNATRGLNNLVYIQVNNGTDVINEFSFVLYTVFPQIILSDIYGSPIQNYLTSKEVMLTWTNVTALFNPYVEIIYPNGTRATISSGFSVKDEGTYTVRCANDMGAYTSGQIVFTIQDYLISIYGVYQITSSGQTVQLLAFTDNYKYTTKDGRELSISQYMFLSNDSVWDRNISIICNEDKDLAIEKDVETFGNTRISRVYGKDKGLYQLEMYFAVTRIPSLNVSNYTNFRINNDSTTKSADFKTGATTITWTTTYTDTSGASEGRTTSYANFFKLNLEYNGTYVGTYTSGSIRLTNSGIYTISIVDPVGQKHYFGSNSTTFTLTILTNVIYYVNDNAAIPYATYSETIDFYVPSLEYYDHTPVVTIYRNNAQYELSPNEQGHYIFSTPGSYKIVMTASIENIMGSESDNARFSAVHQFVIVSPNEAINSYDFTAIAGYEIIDVVRLDNDTDITAEIKGDNAKITSLHIDPDGLGIGKYQITVRTEAVGYNPSQTYTFSIWINNESVVLTPSRDWGSSSRSGFSVTLNTASIYERIGECQVTVNGAVLLAINSSNKDKVDPSTIGTFTQQGDYIVQLVSASGTVLQSYRMTIQEPLNTAAIILIVVAILVVVVLAIVFVIMRRKVRVR